MTHLPVKEQSSSKQSQCAMGVSRPETRLREEQPALHQLANRLS